MISLDDAKREPREVRESLTAPHWVTQPAIVEAVRSVATRSVPVAPAVLLMTAGMLGAGILTLSGLFGIDLDRATIMLGVFGTLTISAIMLVTRTRQVAPVRSERSAMQMTLSGFLTLFALSTVLVGLSGIRPDFADVIRQTAVALYPAICFFALNFAARRLDADRALLLSCHTIMILSAASVTLDYAGVTRIEIYGDRYFGFLGDGVAWVLTLPLVIYFSSNRFVLAALAAATLLLTLSRGPFLVVGGALSFLLLFSGGRRRQYLISAVILCAVITYQAAQFSALTERFTQVGILENDRVVTSLNGIKVFWESPVYGYGYNALAFVFPFILNAQRLYGEHAVAMSPLVQILSDGGAVAFAGYLAFLIASSVTGFKLVRLAKSLPAQSVLPGMAAWLIAMLWFNQTASWLLAGSFVTPVVFGVAGIVAGSHLRLMREVQPETGFSYRNRPAFTPLA